MHVYEATGVEKLVDCERNLAPYTEYRTEKICSRTQICDFTQKLGGMTLRLERIVGCRRTLYLYFRSLQLKRLLSLGGELNHSVNNQCGTDVLMRYFVIVVHTLTLKYYLNSLVTATVVEVDKSERLAITQISHPTAKSDLLASKGSAVLIYVPNQLSFHKILQRFAIYTTYSITYFIRFVKRL